MNEFEDVQRLIRLKRYEQPREGYFDDFLQEFQQRQRSELLQRSARSLLWERVSTYFPAFEKKRNWAYAAGAAYACAMMAFLFTPSVFPNKRSETQTAIGGVDKSVIMPSDSVRTTNLNGEFEPTNLWKDGAENPIREHDIFLIKDPYLIDPSAPGHNEF